MDTWGLSQPPFPPPLRGDIPPAQNNHEDKTDKVGINKSPFPPLTVPEGTHYKGPPVSPGSLAFFSASGLLVKSADNPADLCVSFIGTVSMESAYLFFIWATLHREPM